MNEEIKALQSELALLKLQLSDRVGKIEARLSDLVSNQEPEITFNSETKHESPTSFNEGKPQKLTTKSATTNQEIQSRNGLSQKQKYEEKPVKLNFVVLFFQALLSTFLDWFSPVSKIYESYKARGMVGILILTVVGIALTLAGFGYLMQLLIDQLAAGAKALFMCFAAISVVGFGIGLKIKTRFTEFATAVVTLGLLLAYSTVYFAGSVYSVIPDWTLLVLYLTIALVCHFLALWLDTKIVASLGVMGIASMPIISNAIGFAPFYYLLSLTLVVASSLFLAYRYLGSWLAQLSFAFSLISIEWLLGIENITLSSWVINLFYLQFFVYIAASLLKESEKEKHLLVFLASLVGATIIVFLQSSALSSVQLSIIFIVNAVLATVTSIIFYKLHRALVPIWLSISAIWMVLVVVAVFSNAYWGAAWAFEGLLLLFIGKNYVMARTVQHGQSLIAIALLYCLFGLFPYFPLPALQTSDGWMLSLAIVVIIGLWLRLIDDSEGFSPLAKNKIKPTLYLLEAGWLSTLVIASLYIWIGPYTGIATLVVQIVLLFWARKCKQASIEILAAFLVLIPILYAYQGAMRLDSFRFMTLPLFAKLSVVSAFCQLWLWAFYYRKYQPDSLIKRFAESARILFYMLIPICWVGSVIRKLENESLTVLWASPLLAVLIVRYIKHPILEVEVKILTAVKSILFVGLLWTQDFVYGLLSILGLATFYGVVFMLNYRSEIKAYSFIYRCGILSFGFALPLFIFAQSDSALYGGIFAAFYWAGLLSISRASENLMNNAKLITAVNLALLFTSFWSIPADPFFALIPIIFLATSLYKKEQQFKRSVLGEYMNQNADLFLHTVAAITYTILLASLTSYRLDLLVAPVLAIHGVLILFLKSRYVTNVKYSFTLMLLGILKLAFIDAENAILWQKVALFMGVGVFILAASFWYQKLIDKNNE